MESLPDAILQYILSHVNNGRDVAACNCVSKRWKESTPYITTLYFPRSVFDNVSSFVGENADAIVRRMISRVVQLKELIVYCPFSSSGLASWLSLVGLSLHQLELRMDNLATADNQGFHESPSKLDCVNAARNLKSLKLWSVLMVHSPKWHVFPNLKNLEIVGARLKDSVLNVVLQSCPFLTRLLLLACEGFRSVSIDLPYLEQCKLDFYGTGHCYLTLTSPKIESLEVQGCSWIRVPETKNLRTLSISNSAGRVYMVDFGDLTALEFLSMRGIQWCWDAICKMLKLASEVKHLYMKVEFTGDYEVLQPFPEIDFVDFFNSHQKLRKFDIHGAMFAALCQKNSLQHVDSGFVIPFLEEVIITVRSPLNAEQKMGTLESLLKYGKSLRAMVIKILGMKSCHTNADEFFDDICGFRYMNRKIVRIE
ncbi:F-box protein At1g10780-like [Abrus precatorius]|uniref:F-box protein At1g10780-like n=1 Tax=Abrus precatorius TaxID=3816 RepID=A0A8B8KXF8_ABRPR|nr:F-box protein At1g10780-like [Abrus precatorius]